MLKNAMCLLVCMFASSANAALVFLGNNQTDVGPIHRLSTETAYTNGGPVSDSAIETFLGLAAGTLDGLVTALSGDAVEGSALKDDAVAVVIGDTFSFDWEFSTDEIIPGLFPASDYRDFAFYSLKLVGPTGTTVLADAFNQNGGASGTVSFTALQAGTLAYGVGVMDVLDPFTTSYLSVSNIRLVPAGPATVPEPASLALLGLGLLGMVYFRSKKAA